MMSAELKAKRESRIIVPNGTSALQKPRDPNEIESAGVRLVFRTGTAGLTNHGTNRRREVSRKTGNRSGFVAEAFE